MKIAGFLAAFLLFFGSLAIAQNLSQASTPIVSGEEQVLYCMGIMIADDIKKSGLEQADKAIILKGIQDYINGNATVDLAMAKNIINKKKNEANIKAGEEFLSKNKLRPEVTTLPSGLQYEVLHKGAGIARPAITDRVRVHYHGTLLDGKVFDSSVQKGRPFDFFITQVIRGWQEVIPMMAEGDKWKLYIPQNMAYGERNQGAIPAYSTLVFEVELIAINPPQQTPPPTPGTPAKN